MTHGCDEFNDGRTFKRVAKAAMMAGLGRAAASWGDEGPFGRHGPFGQHGPFAGRGSWGPGGPSGPGGRGRRGRQFAREELRLLLLTLIAQQPRHGYDLIKALEELSGGHYSPSPGVIYPSLSLLADEGLVAEQASEDQRRKFAITDAGTAELATSTGEAEQAMARLKGLAEQAERHRSPPVERAAFSLFAAVAQRLKQGGDGELPHQIAEIIDEAVRKIERL